ncbi:MAG: YbjP/YqhG family protein [Proteobacteria bacterium]|nr:YbjP/YqhG family protein [Pseudomonadota bacterium]
MTSHSKAFPLLSRRTLGLAVAASALAPRLALAQSATDPVETVRTFFATVNERNERTFLTREFNRLFARQRRRSREMDSPLPGLDADYLCLCQEEEDGWKNTLRFELVAKVDNRVARVRVKFRNYEEREVIYALHFENGRWLIDNIEPPGERSWQYRLQETE